MKYFFGRFKIFYQIHPFQACALTIFAGVGIKVVTILNLFSGSILSKKKSFLTFRKRGIPHRRGPIQICLQNREKQRNVFILKRHL